MIRSCLTFKPWIGKAEQATVDFWIDIEPTEEPGKCWFCGFFAKDQLVVGIMRITMTTMLLIMSIWLIFFIGE